MLSEDTTILITLSLYHFAKEECNIGYERGERAMQRAISS